MPITKTEASGGGGGANMIVTLVGVGNLAGTITATVTGGTAPYTYVWSQAQNNRNIHQNGGMEQIGTPNPSGDILAITNNAVFDGIGSAVLWQVVVTDSLGNKAVGHYMFTMNT